MSRPRWCRLITPLTAALIAVALAGPAQAGPAFTEAGAAVEAALRARLAPDGAFVVWGGTAPGRGNPTLRADLDRIAAAATALGAAAPRLGATDAERAAVGRRLARLVEDYRGFVAARWPIGATTAARFDAAAAAIARALPTAPPATDNPHLAKVDAAIADPAWRAAIRAVQPAVVSLGGGTGVNLAPTGRIVTAAHVVDEVGRRLTVRFPDGQEFPGVCTRLDAALDLAVVELEGATDLPTAALAAAPPRPGDDVVVIGQPGRHHPDGTATGYARWHVSVGAVRGYRAGRRDGEQHLGRTKHDAWTYWGHSGSPLFDRAGAIVALHNSWDSRTAMRHAVTWEALTGFLGR
ncbi:MAG: trypsin-like peptidase domain-containing protein [Kofleriaceae bacterium]|jgi:S1-C subfamily serine protease|nr:trypsin-like peptidase domain-containing protein [Kofleriaceae bacterium]MBP9169045.1 trypsin-like peptidase domain-containing protein [Kofleriaceae bacterium]MBP9861680.1 trypsin-like peptidase domain-containing protein [Kofleriaceae bacterium]